jgi:hypothetical protein
MVKAKTVGYSLSNSVTNVLLPDLKQAKKHFNCALIVAIASSYPLGPDITIVRGCGAVARAILGETRTPVLQHINKIRDGIER